MTGLEPATTRPPDEHSTTELHPGTPLPYIILEHDASRRSTVLTLGMSDVQHGFTQRAAASKGMKHSAPFSMARICTFKTASAPFCAESIGIPLPSYDRCAERTQGTTQTMGFRFRCAIVYPNLPLRTRGRSKKPVPPPTASGGTDLIASHHFAGWRRFQESMRAISLFRKAMSVKGSPPERNHQMRLARSMSTVVCSSICSKSS